MAPQSTVVCIILGLVPVYGFIAYDCIEKRINVTSFNSLGVDHSKTPPLATSMEIPRITRLISFKSYLISVDYLITKYATFDDSQVVEGGFFFQKYYSWETQVVQNSIELQYFTFLQVALQQD